MDLSRLPSDFNLAAAVNMRRENHLGVPPLSEDTLFLTIVPNYSERTRILALDGATLALDDEQLTEWLIEAERQLINGTDNHPIFETALEDTACSVARLPNGQVSMTEVPRQYVAAAREGVRLLTGSSTTARFKLGVETPIRCVARYFLTALPDGSICLRPGKEREVTAFIILGTAGFSYGLWSPAAGLFSEYSFPAPAEISRQGRGRGRSPRTGVRVGPDSGSFTLQDVEADAKRMQLETYIRQAFDQLLLQLSPERIEQLSLSGFTRVVWATEPGMADTVGEIASEYARSSGLDFVRIGVPADEAVAGGLLFGSFNFGDEAVAGAEILPPVNLARDLLAIADKEQIERRRLEAIYLQKRHDRALLTLFAAPVFVAACIFGLMLATGLTYASLVFRDARADARTEELRPALERRKSYEANLKWYQEFITQVSSLRKQQPAGIGMLYELNQNYPFAIDSTFYISDLKLLSGGGVEIKGLARNKDAVTQFLRALEFAGGPESGKRLFSNLTYEVQEGVALPNVPPGTATQQPNMPQMTGLGTAPAPGIIAWSIKGNYLPMAEFVPPPADKNKPAQPPAAAPPKPAA